MNADIVAYILKTNDVPSGAKELTAAGAKAIRFDAAKPRKRKEVECADPSPR